MHVALQIEKLHGTTIRAVHFQICHEASTCRANLRSCASSLDFCSQCEHLVHALLDLQRSGGLSFPDIPSEVAIGDRLCSLSRAGRALETVFLHRAAPFAVDLVRLLDDGQAIVRLDVAVASRQRDTETGHGAIHPFVVAHT